MSSKKKKTPKKYTFAAIAALAVTLGVEHLNGNMKEGSPVSRWEAKVLADDEASDIDFKPQPTTIHWLAAQKTEPASSKNPRQPIELKTYSVECTIAEYLYEDDGDIHLVLKSGDDELIGEIPLPYYPTAEKSGYQKKFIKARKQFHKLVDNDPRYMIRKVIVTGVGFVDKPHGQTGKADNNLELHPVLSIVPKK